MYPYFNQSNGGWDTLSWLTWIGKVGSFFPCTALSFWGRGRGLTSSKGKLESRGPPHCHSTCSPASVLWVSSKMWTPDLPVIRSRTMPLTTFKWFKMGQTSPWIGPMPLNGFELLFSPFFFDFSYFATTFYGPKEDTWKKWKILGSTFNFLPFSFFHVLYSDEHGT